MPIIVIEGLDGSGKHTQAKLLKDAIPGAKLVDFPRYDKPSSSLVKEHLAGRTCLDPTTENPYAASSYYACDRAISYNTEPWGVWLAKGETLVMDRYCTSNLIYQAAKLPKENRPAFRAWLWDYETNRLGLPRPDLVMYLAVEPDVSINMAQKRSQEGESHDKGLDGSMDLYEQNLAYQKACFESAIETARDYGWTTIRCTENDTLRSIEDIHEDMLAVVREKGIL